MKFGHAFFSFVTGLITVICLANSARCDIIYDLRFNKTSLTLSPGASTTLDIYFEETVTGGSLHRLELNGGTNGLIDGSLQAVFSGTGATTATAATGNSGFDNIDPILPGNTTTITQNILLNNPVFGTDLGGGTYRVQLGTLTVTAGIAGDTNTLTLASHPVNSITIDDGFGSLAFTVNNALLNVGSVNINVSAVPEPSLVGLLGLAAAGGVARWRRNRKSSIRSAAAQPQL